jgi:hypothetical protein
MDKTQKKAVEWMLDQYKPVIQRTIINMVLNDLSEITHHFNEQTRGEDNEAKNKLKMDYMFSEHCKNTLVGRLLSVHAPRKRDVIDEIIRQYGLSPLKDEMEMYHQRLGGVFGASIEEVRELLEKYAYGPLYQLSKISEH